MIHELITNLESLSTNEIDEVISKAKDHPISLEGRKPTYELTGIIKSPLGLVFEFSDLPLGISTEIVPFQELNAYLIKEIKGFIDQI